MQVCLKGSNTFICVHSGLNAELSVSISLSQIICFMNLSRQLNAKSRL